MITILLIFIFIAFSRRIFVRFGSNFNNVKLVIMVPSSKSATSHYLNHWWPSLMLHIPGSKVQGANMRPIWGRQGPGGAHVGPMNLAIWDMYHHSPMGWNYMYLESCPSCPMVLKWKMETNITNLIFVIRSCCCIDGICNSWYRFEGNKFSVRLDDPFACNEAAIVRARLRWITDIGSAYIPRILAHLSTATWEKKHWDIRSTLWVK